MAKINMEMKIADIKEFRELLDALKNNIDDLPTPVIDAMYKFLDDIEVMKNE